jgi:hypothetical protein
MEATKLGPNKADAAALVLKSLAGLVPLAGQFLGELIDYIIPELRADRVERYLLAVGQRVEHLEEEQWRTRLTDPGFASLFEESIREAARTATQEKIEYIANLITRSMTEDEVDYTREKHLLYLLSQVNDVEVLILMLESQVTMVSAEEFYKQHKSVLAVPTAFLGSGQELVDKNTIMSSYRAHLVQSGLLQPKFKRLNRGEFPEFDNKTGMMKANGYDVTDLGDLLLRSIAVHQKT